MSRAFVQRSDAVVLFEPFTQVYYLGPEREHPRHLDIPPDPQYTYTEVWRRLLSPPGGQGLTFAKDFPVALPRRLWRVPEMARARHAFLIRHPADSMASMLKSVREDADGTSYTYFNETEMSYGEMEAMLRFVVDELGQDPVVIDHDDVMQRPEEMLRSLLQRLDVEFRSEMLRWTKPLPPHPDIWAGFFEAANRSTGFGHGRPPKGHRKIPDEIAGAIERALPIYERLREPRLRA